MNAVNPRTYITGLLLATLLLAGGLQSQEAPRDPAENAALQYWQTFALLPDADAKAAGICTEKPGEKLTQATRDHVANANLLLLRRGAKMPYCEWGLNVNDGAGLLLPHLAKSRHVARIVTFRFQMLAEDGKASDGVDDLLACLALSRHVGAEGIVISILVHYAMDSILIERAAFFLPLMDEASLRKLADALDQLPPAQTMTDALRSEKRIFLGWFKTELTAAMKDGKMKEAMKKAGMGREILAGMTEKQILAQLDELGRFYDDAIALHALPLDEFHVKAEEQEKRIMKAGPLTRLCMPALARLRPKEVEAQVRFRMFRTAVDVLLNGNEALKRHPCPYGGQPFTHKATDSGFELTSKLKTRKGPVRLVVGGKLTPRAPAGDPPPKAPVF